MLWRAVAFFAREVPAVAEPPKDLRDVEPTFPPEPLALWETVWAMANVFREEKGTEKGEGERGSRW